MTLHRAILTIVALAGAPGTALACPVCFGATDGPLLHGSNMGILALLAVTLLMLSAFGLFFAHLARRSAVTSEPAAPVTPFTEDASR
jgi:hypothetical protein